MAVKDLTANEFNDAVAVPEKLLVVDFWASCRNWCWPSRAWMLRAHCTPPSL